MIDMLDVVANCWSEGQFLIDNRLVFFGLLANILGVLGIGFIVKYTQVHGPYRGGLGKPSNKIYGFLNRLFWTMILLGFVLQLIGVVTIESSY